MTDAATCSLGAYNSEASTTAQEYAIRYPGPLHPYTDVLQRLE
jgi:hypothetical protein